MTVDGIRAYISGLRSQFSRLHAHVDGAALCDDLLGMLAQPDESHRCELLPLERAAETAGYSRDYLRKLATKGTVPATRKGCRLFFDPKDLPRKPRAVVAAAGSDYYDAEADARRVADRRSHGGKVHGTHSAA